MRLYTARDKSYRFVAADVRKPQVAETATRYRVTFCRRLPANRTGNPTPQSERFVCGSTPPATKVTVLLLQMCGNPRWLKPLPGIALPFVASPSPTGRETPPRKAPTPQSERFVCGPTPPVTKVNGLSLQMCGNPRSPKPLPGIALPFVASSPPAGHNRQPDKKPAHRKKRPPKGRPQNKLKPAASRQSARR